MRESLLIVTSNARKACSFTTLPGVVDADTTLLTNVADTIELSQCLLSCADALTLHLSVNVWLRKIEFVGETREILTPALVAPRLVTNVNTTASHSEPISIKQRFIVSVNMGVRRAIGGIIPMDQIDVYCWLR
jgi:hypothetical protein